MLMKLQLQKPLKGAENCNSLCPATKSASRTAASRASWQETTGQQEGMKAKSQIGQAGKEPGAARRYEDKGANGASELGCKVAQQEGKKTHLFNLITSAVFCCI